MLNFWEGAYICVLKDSENAVRPKLQHILSNERKAKTVRAFTMFMLEILKMPSHQLVTQVCQHINIKIAIVKSRY